MREPGEDTDDEIHDAVMIDDEPDGSGGGERGEVVYDCAAWAGETRRLLAGMLDNAGIDQAWQGPSLTVRVADEERVDELVDQLIGSTGAALTPDVPTVVFATAQWSVAMQTSLATALAEDDIPYEWDANGDLMVHAEDDEAVAQLLDEVAEDDDDLVSSDDGVALHDLLGEVFQAAAKLAKRPKDASSLVTIDEASDLLNRLALPFGFEPRQWTGLVAEVDRLGALIDSEAIDEEISQAALVVRDAVRPLV